MGLLDRLFKKKKDKEEINQESQKFTEKDDMEPRQDTKDSRLLEPFIKALRDKDENVQQKAIDALAKIGKPAVEPLIQALKDKDRNVRIAAAEALGKTKDERAVEPLNQALIQACRDNDDCFRLMTGWALAEIGDAIGHSSVEFRILVNSGLSIGDAMVSSLSGGGLKDESFMNWRAARNVKEKIRDVSPPSRF